VRTPPRPPCSEHAVDADRETTAPEELDSLWDFDDPAVSEARFRSRLVGARAAADPALLVELLTQIGRAEGLQGRFGDAARTLDEAEASLRSGLDRAHVRCLLERGRVRNSSRQGDRGVQSFLAAWELARKAGEDALAVDAAHMLGIVEPPDQARAWNDRAMELAVTSPDPRARRWAGSLANNMGWARHDAGAYADALALFESALEARRRDGRPQEVIVARWCVARCERSLGKTEAALGEQLALQAELEAVGSSDGYVLEEIGECLLELGRPDDARPYFASAFEELSADAQLRAGEPERLERLLALSLPVQTEP